MNSSISENEALEKGLKEKDFRRLAERTCRKIDIRLLKDMSRQERALPCPAEASAKADVLCAVLTFVP
jgi:hypothetical protein